MSDGNRLVITEDGSHTIYVPELDEHYHSTHGAIQEAKHVFIEAGLSQFKGRSIKVFEMGLGTGLNAVLTALHAEDFKQDIEYTAVEKYPVEGAQIEAINYGAQIGVPQAGGLFKFIYDAAWEQLIQVTDNLKIRKRCTDLRTQTESNYYDIIYYDAFGPRVQPNLWEPEIFKQVYQMMAPEGCLVTYCAKGSVKRAIKAVGFELETLPGPPGKREMTRGWKR